MLKELELHNVLKHKHLKVNFAEGLNIIRGANEAGKSSMIEGLAYNWFGSAALDKSLDDSVHRGVKKTKFKTRTVLDMQGSEIVCERGASGAEIHRDGKVLCTGQREVTLKMEELFGLPTSKSQDIILAAQNSIRGVLSAGPAAAMEFVEKLGDFQQADQLIRGFTLKVTTGQVKPLEVQLGVAEASLRDTLATEEPNIPQIEGSCAKILAAEETAKKVLARATTSHETLLKAADTSRRKASLLDVIARHKQDFLKFEARKRVIAGARGELPGLKKQVTASEASSSRHYSWQAHQHFLRAKPPETDLLWDDGYEALLGEKKLTEALLRESEDANIRAVTNIAGLKAQRTTETVCPTCEREFDNKAQIEKANAALAARIEGAVSERDQAVARKQEAQGTLAELNTVISIQEQTVSWIQELPLTSINVDRHQVPYTVSWVGPVIPEEPAILLPSELAELTSKIVAYEATLETEPSLVPPDNTMAVGAEEELASMPEPTSQEDLNKSQSELAEAQRVLTATKAERGAMDKVLAAAKTAIAVRFSQIAEAEKLVSRLESDLKELSKNNSVLKELREARGQVAEMLWAKILGGTSAFFSQFRGVQSVVTKSKQGFLVDGSNSRPSGSTLDVLGLALRITIAKVFSTCGVLILDEPSAGCDEERTALMTAGLVSAGFDQVILVTHKQADEGAAGNLIQL